MKYEIKNNQLIFNVSAGLENYSQRNNQLKWVHPKNPKLTMDALSMCNTTSIIMALDYAGWKFPSGKYSQPEDNLCDFILTNDKVLAYYKEKMPAMYDAFERGDTNAYCPNLVHAVLAYGTNQWLGCTNAVTFKEKCPISEILKEIVWFNQPVVMSGDFPYVYASGAKGILGHINTLVGVVYDMSDTTVQDLFNKNSFDKFIGITPKSVIVDDPYGAYDQNFKAGTGNDVVMPFGDFIRCYKPVNDVAVKYAHIIRAGAATV